MNQSTAIGITIGMFLGTIGTILALSAQPKNITHNVTLTIDKPIQAQLDMGEYATLIED